MTQTNGNRTGNLNLGLNYIGIDDILREFGQDAFKGRVVIDREDLNSSLNKSGLIISDERIAASAENVRYLSGLGARVVILAHQGRTGKSDCIPLKEHAEKLSGYLRKPVIYHPGFLFGEPAEGIVAGLKPGEIFQVDNTRFLAEEDMKDATPTDYSKTNFVRTLEGLADYYVNNAFSVAHRAHASTVGFVNIPNIAGKLMEREIEENTKAVQNIQSPYVLILGGVKIDDYFDLMVTSLETNKDSYILPTGALALLAIMRHGSNPDGIQVGDKTIQFLRDEKILNLRHKVAGLITEYRDRFALPDDFVVEVDGNVEVLTVEQIGSDERRDRFGIYDLGPQTIEKYTNIIRDSKTRYFKGPAGFYEREEFRKGSKALLEATTEPGGYSIGGGGDTRTLMELCELRVEDFDRFSLSGGAFIQFIAGRRILPGLILLNTTYNAFNGNDLRTGIPAGYRLSYNLVAPKFPGK